jgi:hypothetical protein
METMQLICMEGLGGGPITAAALYWITKVGCYGTAAAVAGGAVITTGGVALGAASAVGGAVAGGAIVTTATAGSITVGGVATGVTYAGVALAGGAAAAGATEALALGTTGVVVYCRWCRRSDCNGRRRIFRSICFWNGFTITVGN